MKLLEVEDLSVSIHGTEILDSVSFNVNKSENPTGGAAGAIDQVVYANIFEGLTRYQADGSIAPALAKSWDISDDGLSYTFHF